MRKSAWIASAIAAFLLTPFILYATIDLGLDSEFRGEAWKGAASSVLLFPFGWLGEAIGNDIARWTLIVFNSYLWAFLPCASIAAIFCQMFPVQPKALPNNRAP